MVVANGVDTKAAVEKENRITSMMLAISYWAKKFTDVWSDDHPIHPGLVNNHEIEQSWSVLQGDCPGAKATCDLTQSYLCAKSSLGGKRSLQLHLKRTQLIIHWIVAVVHRIQVRASL
jgi:hypothetical protein